jgi:thiosulfate reductase/polysulfide reductase chain A
MNVLIREHLIDRDFVAKWTVGFEQLAAHVAASTPEWAARVTELPADRIRETAQTLGRNRPQSVIVPGRHVVWYGNDTQRMRAVYMVNALLGAYGRPGGLYFNRTPYLEEHPHPPYAVVGGAGG